ncbi:MAG: hypothetical protein K0R29_2746, partial [Pseudobdellovibrio sp.]|nr:hypothetical protein [Pseudobdellovibrio sp.]
RDVTDYRQTCRNEVQCYLVPGDRVCREVTECGTNVHGEPICKTRTVCEDGSSTQRCEDRQVCSSEPYTRQECGYDNVSYTDRECGYEQVPYQREVTGYRDETRYRYETRTRTVTRYREEIRCCETRTRQVFDKQLSFQVSVHFPQNAVLTAGEVEKLNIVLETATAKTATVSLQSVDTIWLYKIKSQTAVGAGINIELEATAQWDATTAGPVSIKNAVLNWAPTVKRFQFSFTDSVKNAKITSTYKVAILDEKGKKLEEKSPVADANGLVNFLFEKVKDKKAKIKAVLTVSRTGRPLVGSPLTFNMDIALRPVE